MATNNNAVEIAVQIRDLTKSGIDSIKSGMEDIEGKTASVKSSLIGLFGVIAAGVSAGAFIEITDDLQKAENAAIQAANGSVEALEKIKAVSKDVWLSGFGESATQAAQMVTQAFKEMGNASEEEIKKAATAAAQLEKTFGADYSKSIQSIGLLMRDFGLSSKEATDFVTAGFQRNLDASGDFLDSILEYAPQFVNAGAGASDFFSVLESGNARGALGTDKAVDAFKEFTIRIKDGSKSTADSLKMIGLDADQMAQAFNSGTMTTAQAFEVVKQALAETTDMTKQFQAGAALIGGPFEDLGTKGVLALDLTQTKIEDLAGSSEKLNSKYVGIFNSLIKLSREAIAAFADLGGTQISQGIEEQINSVIGLIKSLKDNISTLAPIVLSLSAALISLKADAIAASFLKFSAAAGALKTSLASLAVTLNATATGAKALQGAFIALAAGWAVGSWLNTFPKVQEVAQTFFGALELMVSDAKISFLEVRKAWNDFTLDVEESDHLQKQIDAEKAHQASIKQTIKDIQDEYAEKEKGAQKAVESEKAKIAAVKGRAAIEKEVADVEKKDLTTRIEGFKTETDARKIALDQQMTAISEAEAAGTLSHEDAIAAKLKTEKDYATLRLGIANEILEHAKEVFGIESEEYKKALESKQDADAEFLQYREKAAQERISQNEKEWAENLKDIKENLKAAEDAEKEHQEKLAAIREVNLDQAEAIKDKRLKAIQESLDAEFIAESTAFEQKKQAELDFLQIRIDSANAALEQVVATYGVDSAEYIKALAEKKTATDEFSAKFAERMAEPKPLNIDTEEAEEKTQTLTDMLKDMVLKVSEPIPIDFNIEPAQAALRQLAEEAYQSAAAAQVAILKMQNESTLAVGETARVNALQMEYLSAQYQKNLDLYKNYKDQITEPTETTFNTKFTGEASPVKPLTETINDVTAKIQEFKAEAGIPTTQKINFDIIPPSSADSPIFDWAKNDIDKALNYSKEGLKNNLQQLQDGKLGIDNSIDQILRSTANAKQVLLEAQSQGIQTNSAMQEINTTIQSIMSSINNVQPLNIPITADTGSGAKPFSQAIEEAKNSIAQIAQGKSGGIANFNPGDFMKPPQGYSDPNADPFKIKELGKIDLNIGSKGIPVLAGKEAYLALHNEMRRREYLTIQGK